MSSKLTTRVARRFDQTAERVFDAWLDPKTAGRWLFATPTGTMTRVEIDARVGGKFSIIRRESEDIEHVGEYFEIVRPRRLVFSFGVPKFSPEMTRVAIDITPLASGCELVLVNEGVLAEYGARNEEGWRMILDGLARELAAR